VAHVKVIPWRGIKAVALDLDGVLVDAVELHKEALNAALKDHGLSPITEEEHRTKYNGLPTKTKLEMLGLGSAWIVKINISKQRHTIELIDKHIEPDPEMLDKIDRLAQNMPLCCCSNSVRASVDRLLECAGLDGFMSFTLSNEDVKNPKPAPDIYLMAAEKFGIGSNRLFVVEDNPNGILAATRAGCKICPVENTRWSKTYVRDMLFAYEDQLLWTD
jgi:HAD superfamily hydrolase (TIGR01509 family)